ncbi:dihydrofolate reductase [Pyrenophora seminiperda CCB06]|uniref:Dihydrofolate reductase n=1 Tax=Pyrenophora seminiperda CCB06 TaxID=1302712 RepID=A0A3M7M058_9PLEO|nr:dihydrofolate reductase [Pyrenophora seminiperda CCB06]
MPPKPPALTLILAATPNLGIGNGGGLPWPQLKKEIGFFARVTKRTTPSPSSNEAKKINAVLMGRKTWESIPPKYRPLKDRLNVVITTNPEDFSKKLDKKTNVEGPMVCSGIMDAMSQLERQDTSSLASSNLELDKIFVIGGASIYKTALELPQTKRVLLTKIHKDFECDTFFPVNLEETTIWKNASREEVQDFTGEEIQEGGLEEQGVKFEFCMYERE